MAESILGIMCPLTEWEAALRGDTSSKGFIERFFHAWLFWDFPPWLFNIAYAAFGGLVLWTWVRFPPRAR